MTATSLAETRNHIPWHLVSLVLGLVLAALLAISQSDLSGAQAPASRTSARRLSAFHANAGVVPSVVTFYLAKDEEQIAEIKAKYYEDAARIDVLMMEFEPNRFANVFFARTPEAEVAARALIDDAMAAANFTDNHPSPRFNIIDLR